MLGKLLECLVCGSVVAMSNAKMVYLQEFVLHLDYMPRNSSSIGANHMIHAQVLR